MLPLKVLASLSLIIKTLTAPTYDGNSSDPFSKQWAELNANESSDPPSFDGQTHLDPSIWDSLDRGWTRDLHNIEYDMQYSHPYPSSSYQDSETPWAHTSAVPEVVNPEALKINSESQCTLPLKSNESENAEIEGAQASWKAVFYGDLLKAYEVYGKLKNCSIKKALDHLEIAGNVDLVRKLLTVNNDSERQEAADIIYNRVKDIKRVLNHGKGRTAFGSMQTKVLIALKNGINKSMSTARRHLDENLTPEIIQMIKVPASFDQGIQQLVESYNTPPKKPWGFINPESYEYLLEDCELDEHNYKTDEEQSVTYDGRRLLGDLYPYVRISFETANHKNAITAGRYIKEAVTPRFAKVLVNPRTREQGLEILIESYRRNPPKPGHIRGKRLQSKARTNSAA